MKTYAQNYQKLMSEKGQQVEIFMMKDADIDEIAKKYSGIGGIEDYRSFARDIAAIASVPPTFLENEMNDRDFLMWLYERLENFYGEDACQDYMHKLRAIVKSTPANKVTPWDGQQSRRQINEIYSFDKVGEFTVVVEHVGEVDFKQLYEGVVFLHAVQNPHAVECGNNGEHVRSKLMQVANELCV